LLGRSIRIGLVAAGLLAGLQGCAGPQERGQVGEAPARSSVTYVGEARGEPASEALARVLSEQPGSTSTTLADSRWGPDARVTVRPAYFAASGLRCRELRVTTPERSEPIAALACAGDSGGWRTHRAVAQVVAERGGER